jgi:acyl-homoserine lactone acylase PvdQ
MEKDSISATVYATWQHFFYRGLLWKYTRGSRSAIQNPKTSIWTVESTINLLDHDCSADLYQRILFAIRDNDHSVLDRYDSMLCGGDPYNDLDQADSGHLKRFEGKNCEYNVIRSLKETNKWLVKTYGSNYENWKWGDVHLNDYENVPWSLTPLKYIFHRSVPFAGNSFTINVGRYHISMVETLGYFKSMFSANYKQVL